MDPFKSQEEPEKKKMRSKIFSLLALVVLLLSISTLVYSHLEEWSLFDSLYFSVTMPTVGFSSLFPSTPAAKIFTMVFALSGIAVMLYALSTLGGYYLHYFEHHKPVIRENIKNTIKKLNHKADDDKWVDIYRVRHKK